MGLFSSVIGSVAGPLVSGALGIGSTLLGNNSAKHEAERNRDYQTQMSNTSIQRRMADLKAAGLNPLLAVESASSGASAPSGAQADVKHFDPNSILALSNARLVNAQARAQEQDNNLYTFRKEQIILQNERERQGILNDVGIRELNAAKTLDAKANIYLKRCQANGINMTIEKAKREIQLIDMDINNIKNSPIGQDLLFFNELGKNPLGLASSIAGSGASIFTRGLLGTGRAIYNWYKNRGEKKK